MNIWAFLALGVNFATMLLQLVNYKMFHSDGRNSTRVTLIMKQVFFACHGIMLYIVTDVVRDNFPFWFGHMFGMLYFFGLSCWFFVFVRQSFSREFQ